MVSDIIKQGRGHQIQYDTVDVNRKILKIDNKEDFALVNTKKSENSIFLQFNWQKIAHLRHRIKEIDREC